MYKMNGPGLFDLPIEIRDIISTKVVKIEQDLVDKKNYLYEETLDREHEFLEEKRDIADEHLRNMRLAEYQQLQTEIQTGDANFLQLNIIQERINDNHDYRMRILPMMLKTRQERMNNY